MSFLRVLVILFIACSFLARPSYDPDLGWQLYGGQYILRNLADVFYGSGWQGWSSILPQKDPVNFLNSYWHDYHWLVQIIFSSLYEQGGFELLMLFLPVSVFFSLFLLLRLFQKQIPQGGEIIIWLVIGAFAYLLFQVSSVRPQMLSVLCLCAVMAKLLPGKTKHEGIVTFLTAVLAVNFHVYWIFIPLLYFCLRVLHSECGRREIYTFFLICSAGLFTPYSLGAEEFSLFNLLINYGLLYDYLFIPEVLLRLVSEFQGAYREAGMLSIITAITYLMIIYVSLKNKIPYQAGDLLLLLLSLLLPYYSAKYLPLQIIFLLPVIIMISVALNYRAVSRRTEFLIVIFFLCLSFQGVFPALNNWKNTSSDIYAQQPLDACALIGRTAVRNPTRVATFFDHGGWCRFAAAQVDWSKQILVSTDGRTQGVSNQRYLESLELFATRGDWQKTISTWQADFILTPRYVKLADRLLSQSADFALVYADPRFLLFLNKKLYPEFTS